jgi:hypothetical protein
MLNVKVAGPIGAGYAITLITGFWHHYMSLPIKLLNFYSAHTLPESLAPH